MRISGLGKYGALTAALAVFLLGVGAIASFNYLYASRTAESAAAVGAIAREQLQPRAIAAATQLLRFDLTTRRYLGHDIGDLKANIAAMDAALARLDHLAGAKAAALPFDFSPLGEAHQQRILQDLRQQWGQFRELLKPIAAFNTEAYIETAEHGTQLSPAGLELSHRLEVADRFAVAHHGKMSGLIDSLAQGVEKAVRSRAALLRTWLLAGLGATAALLLFSVFFMRSIGRREQTAHLARQETSDILRTVNQGLFLLDEELKIGSERSEALERIFRRKDFDGRQFSDLLNGLVPDKTLDTATEYVKLLWGERVNEKLIKTINPLGEVEVHFDGGSGTVDTQYLEFDFNRVRANNKVSRILVTVNDVTRRVELSHELQDSQEKAQAQLDLLLHILHVEPRQLTAFLEESQVSLKMVNAILKEPAREEGAFRTKLDGIFRQVHSVKGEAAALGLKTVEQRAHGFEEALSELRNRASLSGNDFLPLVVKLDDLFGHLAQVREMVTKLADLRIAMNSDAERAPPRHTEIPQATADTPTGTVIEPVPPLLQRMLEGQIAGSTGEPAAQVDDGGLNSTLTSLTQRIAAEHSKRAALNCSGLELIPDAYRRAVKEIGIQMVRNSLAHGIESPEERQQHGKAAAGTMMLRFEKRSDNGFELVYQDDGRGLSAAQLKDTAVARGLIDRAQADAMDDRRALSLIFMPGFSTQDEVTRDAGRGVGMDIVRARVHELGGKLGISTTVGKFLRFRIWLPADAAASAQAA